MRKIIFNTIFQFELFISNGEGEEVILDGSFMCPTSDLQNLHIKAAIFTNQQEPKQQVLP